MISRTRPATSARALRTILLLGISCGGSSTDAEPVPNDVLTGDPAEAVVSQSSDPDTKPSAPQGTEQEKPHAVRQDLPSAEEIAALPSDGGPEFNRLVFEASPYLRQHARNPVDWHPWGDEAFALAKELDRPVFLSVGYATCHWCHVMEHESFEDDEVAALMNASFVCVKVDREERPDLDHVYMQVTQGMTGRGGWPMTVLLTPDAEPFFAATYIPKHGRGGRSGMMELLPRIAEGWRDNREAVLSDAQRVTDWLRDNSGGAPGEDLDAEVIAAAATELAGRFDETNKGFGAAPKFPIPHDLSLLLRWSQRAGDEESLRRAEETLLAMRRGGIYDQVGYGFHRYSTDTTWFLPHFEKMLYDQALHVLAYTGAWQLTGRDEYRATAEEIITYVRRDLGDPGGAFYSAEDADSEGEEGVFYTWPLDELMAVLGEEDAALIVEVYGVTDEGNYNDEASRRRTGRSLFAQQRPLEEEAAARGMELEALKARLEAARLKLFDHRALRIRPFLDDKVLTDWNGLMIAALARAGAAFDDESHLDAARGAADFVLRELKSEDGRLWKRWRAGQAGLPATIEDHAFLAWGLLELYQADHDLRWLREARAILDVMIDHFHDEVGGGFFMTADDGTQLLVRAKESYDGAIPSGSSVAACALVQLSRLTGVTRYEELASETFRAFAAQVRRIPSAHAQMLQAVDMVDGGGIEIVISGDPADPRTQSLLDLVHGTYAPNAVVVLHDPARVDELEELSPYAAAMKPVGGAPTAYLCRDFACERPVNAPEELAALLAAALRVEDAPSEQGAEEDEGQ